MNSKERVEKCLSLEKLNENVVSTHWWGLYKYEVAGLDYKRAMFNDGKALVAVYEKFYNTFKPDWFHLHIGTPKYFKDAQVITQGGTKYVIFQDKCLDLKEEDKYFSIYSSSKKEKIIDITDYILESKKNRPKADLSSKRRIDEFVKKYVWIDSELILKLGYTDHLQEIFRKYGDSVFINVHLPSQMCEIIDPFTGYVGFEEGLVAFYDRPEGMKYLIEKCYEAQLEWVKAYKRAGAHAFTISEDNMAADSISPKTYREFLKPIHKDFFKEIKNMNLYTLINFWGYISPLLNDIKEIGVDGLLIEESRKNYKLDVVDIIKIVGDRICLFGNVDSVNTILLGNSEDIRKEIDKQREVRKYGSFIFSNGSPFTPGTPKENVFELINYARRV